MSEKFGHSFHRSAGVRRIVTIAGAVAFRWAPPGSYVKGSPESEEGRVDDGSETQRKAVVTQGFWLAETPTTQRLWKDVTGRNPSRFQEDDLRPVECVSWYDCQEFIELLNFQKLPGAGVFRLPTEIEWEYACRAGTRTAYPWGNALNGDMANCDGRYPCGTTKRGRYLGTTSRVGSFPANPWGFFDMNGNVEEWCDDKYFGSFGDEDVSLRVYRGGSWRSRAQECRSASLTIFEPDIENDDVGFRLVMTDAS